MVRGDDDQTVPTPHMGSGVEGKNIFKVKERNAEYETLGFRIRNTEITIDFGESERASFDHMSVTLFVPGDYAREVDQWTSKVGGSPNWLCESSYVDKLLCCQICRLRRALLVQLCAPAFGFSRTVYVFVCLSKACVDHPLRFIAISQSKNVEDSHSAFSPMNSSLETAAPKRDLVWLTGSDQGDSLADELDRLMNIRETQMKVARCHTAGIEINHGEGYSTVVENEDAPIRAFYLVEVPEPAELPPALRSGQREIEMLKRYEADQENLENRIVSHETLAERYETRPGKAFRAFCRRAERRADQCIRYDFGGEPLFLYESTKPRSHICDVCKESMTFEFQIMPGLLTFLPPELSLDFGTVNVYACKSRGCTIAATSNMRVEATMGL